MSLAVEKKTKADLRVDLLVQHVFHVENHG